MGPDDLSMEDAVRLALKMEWRDNPPFSGFVGTLADITASLRRVQSSSPTRTGLSLSRGDSVFARFEDTWDSEVRALSDLYDEVQRRVREAEAQALEEKRMAGLRRARELLDE